MHADALPPPHKQEPGWGLPLALAVLVHLLVALVFIGAWLWSPQRNTEAAAGDPSVEASLAVSSSEAAAARQALRQSEKLEELPEPVAEPIPVPEDTIPPPQPIEEPRPQDAPTPQQQQAQERVAQPDTQDQEAVNALAISQEKAKQEQEAKRRQEQIDLTERKRQEEAEQKARLAKQQEEDAKKKIAEQQRVAADKAEADRQKKIAEIRAKREQAEKEAKLAEQKLRQVAAARNAAGSANAGSSGQTQPAGGGGGTSDDLSAKYAAALVNKIRGSWTRPDSVPLGQKCQITITQIPGGQVLQAKVGANCPYDEAGKRSIEAAVLNAQPLPYRGFEQVFARTLNLTFTPQD
ncbi:cell envelope integrity protein TolA [Stenotrophomonas sp. ZAC14D2_NAIMI4_7]|uniref:cell envelope integrity protein TolA n=1 Tax=Stenotrophomonas sp. ZAC14D2_NAIMI4_7 TaxID=2072405 RepID=UPI000D541A33|nr:cell envelope integrity protein TolA [Stenotrophomonas sp. ZAC14D2_NAIMI4_7]AWH18881.1 cell envelope integrity protein TolA [Stenotrophomonas sp. ZAC14D2_NAIMI4_7]